MQHDPINNREEGHGTDPKASQESALSHTTENTTPVAENTITEETQSSEKEPVNETPEPREEVSSDREIKGQNTEEPQEPAFKKETQETDKDYEKMSLEALAMALEKYSKTEYIQLVKSDVHTIHRVFKQKFQALEAEKKAAFINEGGHEIDFYYNPSVQRQYKAAYKTYRNKLNEHYQELEKTLKENLVEKLKIIDEIKALLNVEENINTTYNQFKNLQERWQNTGPIPRDKHNNAWNSYHHHVELFYDFLHLNRDLRDLDFKHNLEEKEKLVQRAEALTQATDPLQAFRELQGLHKIWKEELGPVARAHRKSIWERFKAATKVINDQRQHYFKEIDKIYEKNLEAKERVIEAIEVVADQDPKSTGDWQKNIKTVEKLREEFFSIGKVPLKVNENTWTKFRTALRQFNKKKNTFYKNLKKHEEENLKKKQELVKIAEDNKDNDDFETTTVLMKKIQSDWKSIGHVPRRHSNSVWKQFKAACNHYFDRLHATKSTASKAALEAFHQKQVLLNSLATQTLSNEKTDALETVRSLVKQWKSIGNVPREKHYIDTKFYKSLDKLLAHLDMEPHALEMILFEYRLEHLSSSEDTRQLDNERSFISKKVDELKARINQLENNLHFFAHVDQENPMVKNVRDNIDQEKETLALWQKKLIKIKAYYQSLK